jgi:hypothetical protein
VDFVDSPDVRIKDVPKMGEKKKGLASIAKMKFSETIKSTTAEETDTPQVSGELPSLEGSFASAMETSLVAEQPNTGLVIPIEAPNTEEMEVSVSTKVEIEGIRLKKKLHSYHSSQIKI